MLYNQLIDVSWNLRIKRIYRKMYEKHKPFRQQIVLCLRVYRDILCISSPYKNNYVKLSYATM